MKLHIGSSTIHLPGFLNVDVRPVEGVDLVAHAGRLAQVEDASVEVIFANAFLEHLFVGQQLAVLREWSRVLRPDGMLIVLGIPDFEAIARAYLSRAPGIVGERFDLFNVYRYSHGDPEQTGVPEQPETWAQWDPAAAPDGAPSGWLPQLHKSLYDTDYLHDLLDAVGFASTIFSYAWGDEETLVNLGVIARRQGSSSQPSSAELAQVLAQAVSGVDRFVRLASLQEQMRKVGVPTDSMLEHARRLHRDAAGDSGAQPPAITEQHPPDPRPGLFSKWRRR